MTYFLRVLIAYLMFIGLAGASDKENLFQYRLYEQNRILMEPSLAKRSTTASDLSKPGEKEDLHLEEHDEPKYGVAVANFLRTLSPKTFPTPITKIILSYLRTIMKPQSWVAQGHMRIVRLGVIFGYQSRNLRLLTVGEDANRQGLISMWDLTHEALLLRQFIHPRYVTCCSVAPNEQFMVATCGDSFLYVWDLTTIRDVHRTPTETYLLFYNWCKILADNQTVIAVDGFDQGFHIWIINDDATTFEFVQTCRGERFRGTHSAIFTIPSDNTLIYLDQNQLIKKLNLQSGAYQCKRPSHPIYSCSVSADGQIIVSGSTYGSIEVWNARTGRSSAQDCFREPFCVDCVVSTDGKMVAGMITNSHRFCVIKCWKLTKEKNQLVILYAKSLHGLGQSLRISPDDAIVAVAVEHTIYLWDFASGRYIVSLKYHDCFWVDWFYITQDSWYIIATTKNKNNSVKVYVEEISNFIPNFIPKQLRYKKKWKKSEKQ